MTKEEKNALKKKGLITGKDYKSELAQTNLTIFRHYVEASLREDEYVTDKNQFLLVRQLPPTPTGLPLELWYYYSVTKFENYEDLAATRIENLIASLKNFDLKLFQQPSGHDWILGLSQSDNGK